MEKRRSLPSVREKKCGQDKNIKKVNSENLEGIEVNGSKKKGGPGTKEQAKRGEQKDYESAGPTSL